MSSQYLSVKSQLAVGQSYYTKGVLVICRNWVVQIAAGQTTAQPNHRSCSNSFTMSSREQLLSYSESYSDSELTDNSLPPEDKVGTKEWCQVRCKPSFQVRKLKNKGAILIIVWSCLITNIYLIGAYIATHKVNALANRLSLVAIVFSTFLSAILADIRFGRYKVVSCSLWIMWTSSLLLTINSVIMDRVHFEHKEIVLVMLLLPMGVGWAVYEANIVQFGIDQLVDASATECKSFIIWLCWSYFASVVAVEYVLNCVDHNTYFLLLMSFNVTVALALKLIFSHVLIKEPITHNPFQLVYRVIKYAIKHKYPRQRSAFTYCEDTIPSRIDFGKTKYGGPFTTEQVEDVKTLLRTILFILGGSALFGIGTSGFYYRSQITNKLFTNDMSSSLLSIRKCSYEYIINNFYSISATILIPIYELVIHPLFHRLIPNIQIPYKAIVGSLLHLSTLILLLTLVTYTRYTFLSNEMSTNATLECLLHEPPGSLETYLDNRWNILSEILHSIGDVMFGIFFFEYMCAQVPYSMKGLAVGILVFSMGTFIALFTSVDYIFNITSLTWATGVISCEFWYFVVKIFLLVILLLISIVVVLKYYKNRKREDVLPNEHIFAERYYSS